MSKNPYNKEALAKTMPEKLKYFRKINKLSVYDVAEQLNKSAATVSLWENGKALPDIDTLLKLCNIYGVDDVNELISYYESPELKSLTKTENHLLELFRNSEKKIQKAIILLLENKNPEAKL